MPGNDSHTVSLVHMNDSNFPDYGWGSTAGDIVSDGSVVYDPTPASQYTCYLSHVSSADTEPGVGENWGDYWLPGMGSGGTAWATSTQYYAMDDYTCILSHLSSADTEPRVGVDWATYWVDSGADDARVATAWATSTHYYAGLLERPWGFYTKTGSGLSPNIDTSLTNYPFGNAAWKPDSSNHQRITATHGESDFSIVDLSSNPRSVTVDCWIRRNTITTAQHIYAYQTGGGGGAHMMWFGAAGSYSTGNKVNFGVAEDFGGGSRTWYYAYTTNNIGISGSSSDGLFHHIAGVFDATHFTVSIYVDGVLQVGSGGTHDSPYAIGTAHSVSADLAPLTIGYNPYHKYCLDAWVQEFRISNFARWAPDYVTGDGDGLIYACILDHTSWDNGGVDTDRPPTGTNYATYWKKFTSGNGKDGGTWASGKKYSTGGFTPPTQAYNALRVDKSSVWHLTSANKVCKGNVWHDIKQMQVAKGDAWHNLV